MHLDEREDFITLVILIIININDQKYFKKSTVRPREFVYRISQFVIEDGNYIKSTNDH